MLKSLTLKPGVNRESTRYAAEGTWFETDKVRFSFGLPEAEYPLVEVVTPC